MLNILTKSNWALSVCWLSGSGWIALFDVTGFVVDDNSEFFLLEDNFSFSWEVPGGHSDDFFGFKDEVDVSFWFCTGTVVGGVGLAELLRDDSSNELAGGSDCCCFFFF